MYVSWQRHGDVMILQVGNTLYSFIECVNKVWESISYNFGALCLQLLLTMCDSSDLCVLSVLCVLVCWLTK